MQPLNCCVILIFIYKLSLFFFSLFIDVEELSTKLMAKLAEVQSLEGGTFFIGNADALRMPTSAAATAATLATATSAFHHPQHVMLPGECW